MAVSLIPSNYNIRLTAQVFGNSNSLPISLVISLSKTISGLHWDQIPGDNDDEVAARGILYLLIFQQLGQLVRWTWGYNVLLKPRDECHEEEEEEPLLRAIEEGHEDVINAPPEDGIIVEQPEEPVRCRSGEQTPVNDQLRTSSYLSSKSTSQSSLREGVVNGVQKRISNGSSDPNNDSIVTFPNINSSSTGKFQSFKQSLRSYHNKFQHNVSSLFRKMSKSITQKSRLVFQSLPKPVQTVLSGFGYYSAKFIRGVWEFMNPPLWAMLVAILVASIPDVQRAFFTKGTFINNSIVRAVSQSGGVAVPLILVVLGANLARNTLPKEDPFALEDSKYETKLLVASLISRMLLPLAIMGPILAVVAKYVPVSIVDDPIFVIVCFLLTGAPSALQLAQICQINNVYMGAMSRLLFQSYVVW
jgi:predicted permease